MKSQGTAVQYLVRQGVIIVGYLARGGEMNVRRWTVAVGLGGLLLATIPVAAHHSIASQYDFKQEVVLTGTLLRVDWIRPHSIAFLEVANPENGTKEAWMFEFAGLNQALGGQLRAAPSKGGMAPGQTYTMYGFKAKNGKTQAFLKQLKMPDGRVVVAWFGDPNG
jgi:hypothetical protein